MSAIKKEDLSICCLLKESALILEQTSRSYGGLKLGLFVTKLGLFVQFQRVPFGKSTQIYSGLNVVCGMIITMVFISLLQRVVCFRDV